MCESAYEYQPYLLTRFEGRVERLEPALDLAEAAAGYQYRAVPLTASGVSYPHRSSTCGRGAAVAQGALRVCSWRLSVCACDCAAAAQGALSVFVGVGLCECVCVCVCVSFAIPGGANSACTGKPEYPDLGLGGGESE